jgi:hypothetical protein
MKCVKCGTETSAGDVYRFYYGNYVGDVYINRRHSLTKYQIGGEKNVFLCDKCVDHYTDRIALFISAGLAILGILTTFVRLLIGPSSEGSESEAFVGLFVVLLGILLYFGTKKEWKKQKPRSGFGDMLAIRIHKKELKNAGYRKFFTRENYKRLQQF